MTPSAATTTIREALEKNGAADGWRFHPEKREAAIAALASLEQLVEAAQRAEQGFALIEQRGDGMTGDETRAELAGIAGEMAGIAEFRRSLVRAALAAVGPGEEPAQ